MLPRLVRVRAGGVMQVEEQGGPEGGKRYQSCEQHHAGPVREECHLARLAGGRVGDRGLLLGEVGIALVAADSGEQSVAVGQPFDRAGRGDQRGGPANGPSISIFSMPSFQLGQAAMSVQWRHSFSCVAIFSALCSYSHMIPHGLLNLGLCVLGLLR